MSEYHPRGFFYGADVVKERDILTHGETDLLRVTEIPTMGKGLEAKCDIPEGNPLFCMSSGNVERYRQIFYEAPVRPHSVVVDVQQSVYAVTRDVVIEKTLVDPPANAPLRWINHSCYPNASRHGRYMLQAGRAIDRGEEVTVDYSTLETNPFWVMICARREIGCRVRVGAIGSLTVEQVRPYWAHLPEFMRRVFRNQLKVALPEDMREVGRLWF